MFFSHEGIAMKAGVGFEFGIADSVDPAPTRHFLNQSLYPIEFAATQDHVIPNPSFLLQVVVAGDHRLLGSAQEILQMLHLQCRTGFAAMWVHQASPQRNQS
jgi:hypothetical protein